MSQTPQKKSSTKTLLNIATLLSIIYMSLKLAFNGYISGNVAAAFIVGGAFLLVFSSVVIKIIVTLLCIVLTSLLFAHATGKPFEEVIIGVGIIIAVTIFTYLKLKSLFKGGNT